MGHVRYLNRFGRLAMTIVFHVNQQRILSQLTFDTNGTEFAL